jgi:ATP-dependent helicase/nuclease subunit B
MHQIIDEFSRLLVRNNISWRGLDREWCREQISSLVDEQLEASGGRILKSSRRYIYLSERLKRIIVKAVLLISMHIEMSGFEPSGYEVEFSDTGRYPPITIEVPSGQCIKMTGRIDRIDSMTNEDGTYLRIIDYKSGNKALKLEDVYYGLQLQLVTYMDAVLEADENGAAAGILYFRLDDPLIRCGRDSTDEDIEKAIMKELRMKGLVLADVKLVREMDRQIDGDSLIIPARINRDGSLGRSSAATSEQFNVLRSYVRKTLASIGSGLLEGNVLISPYKKRSITACTYCSFKPVCQFDTSMRGNRYRIVPDFKDDEYWNLMREAGKAADSGMLKAGTAGQTGGMGNG